jgi:hypothetical protein
MVEIVLCCRLQFGDATIAIVLFGQYYSDGNSRFAIGMVVTASQCWVLGTGPILVIALLSLV